MKQFILVLLIGGMLLTCPVFGQFKDIQLHYETGSFKAGEKTIKRDFFKAKLQVLHRDTLGITYLNTEIDYNSSTKGMSFGQFTLLRSLKLRPLKFVQPTVGHAAILGRDNMWFAGVLIPAKFGRVTVLPLFLYQYSKNANTADARTMIGVSTKLFNDRVAIFGFASAWTYDNRISAEVIDGKKVGWQLSPQIWFHLNKAFAIGSKIDFSRNLYSADGTCDFLPTAGVRWVY